MAATSQWYGQAAAGIVARQWSPPTVMNVILMKTTFVPNIDSQLRYSDVSAQELAAGGAYTVGGVTIGSRSISYDAPNDEYNLLGADVTWGPGATFITHYGIIYEQSTTDKYLWALLDFGADVNVSSGVFQIDWTAGLLSVQVGPPV